MSIYFVTNKGKEVSHLSNGRAKVFAGVSNGIAEAFSMPRPIAYDTEEDHFAIDEEKFCALVEYVFTERPLDVVYSWAEWAAGIYQSIKGQLYEWHWPGTEIPVNCLEIKQSTLFQAKNISKYWPREHSGKSIEPPPYK